jgi:hypothetical protein
VSVSAKAWPIAGKLEAEAAELGEVAEQEPRAQQHDPDLQPELVGPDAGPEERGHADRVADDEADHDGPQHVLDVGQAGAGRRRDRTQAGLRERADDADDQQEQQAGQVAQRGGGPGAGGCGGAHLTRKGIEGSSPISPSATKTAATITAAQSAPMCGPRSSGSGTGVGSGGAVLTACLRDGWVRSNR